MNPLVPKLLPPETKPHVSVARVERAWYVVCASTALRAKPLSTMLLGIPLVVFRGAGGEPGALLDRCPHRNVPLSLGRVREQRLECAYHGWQFERDGACAKIPCLVGETDTRGRRASAFPTCERDGFVWVWPSLEHAPTDEPFPLPLARDPQYTTIRRAVDVECSVHAAIENALDVPHTAFLHAGLFRGTGPANDIEVRVQRTAVGVEAEYLGEPRPKGLAGKILAPGGGVVVHYDRFFLPSVAQVEYRLGERTHFLVTSLCTPVEDFRTRMHAVVSYRLPFPGWLVRPILEPVAMRIFRQDAAILQRQTETIRRFGGERYVSTEIDVLGGHIWRLLKAAENGEVVGSVEEHTRLRVG
jgi:phenylpropionate dioxygenase-like ring-hydroxylating dioxygenase large terminal subunit